MHSNLVQVTRDICASEKATPWGYNRQEIVHAGIQTVQSLKHCRGGIGARTLGERPGSRGEGQEGLQFRVGRR